jgi:hypothetical protein
MEPYIEKVKNDFESWKVREPGTIEKISGFVGKPVEVVIQPFIEKISPLLEDVLKNSNKYIAEAIVNSHEEIKDITKFAPDDFIEWHKKADEDSDTLIKAGIATLSAEGAVGGFLGFNALLAEVPVSFGTILAFANKIAATYHIDITNEDTQIEILKAITAGSSSSLENKNESTSTFSISNIVIQKVSWGSIASEKIYAGTSALIVIKQILKTLGIGISRRKAAQFLPGLGAVTGGLINGGWANESLSAVKEYCRYTVAQKYFEVFYENSSEN